MGTVHLHHDGRIEVTDPPTPEEIAEAEGILRRVAAILMGMAVQQLARDAERATAEANKLPVG
jgi:hypothetical protein